MFKRALMLGSLAIAAMLVSDSTAKADNCYGRPVYGGVRSVAPVGFGVPAYGVSTYSVGRVHSSYRPVYGVSPYRSYRGVSPVYRSGYGGYGVRYGHPGVGLNYGRSYYPGYRGGISIGFGF